MTEREYLSRIEALQKKAFLIGAEFEHEFFDKDHLDCFWYGRCGIASIKYREHTVWFDVYGEIRIALYDGENFDCAFSKKSNARPFFENDDVREKIIDDKVLRKKTESGDLMFDNNNWISIDVVKESDANWNLRFEPEVAGETNLLEAVENNFDHYIAFIDGLLTDSNN